jgi:hypothetical protein
MVNCQPQTSVEARTSFHNATASLTTSNISQKPSLWRRLVTTVCGESGEAKAIETAINSVYAFSNSGQTVGPYLDLAAGTTQLTIEQNGSDLYDQATRALGEASRYDRRYSAVCKGLSEKGLPQEEIYRQLYLHSPWAQPDTI